MGPKEGLMELIWQNGNVVMHNQNCGKVPTATNELKQVQKPPQIHEEMLVNPSNLIQEDENAMWFQYPIDDPLDKELCLEFFSEMFGSDVVPNDKINRGVAINEQGQLKFDDTHMNNGFNSPVARQSTLPSTKPHDGIFSSKNESIPNVSDIPKPVKGKLTKDSECLTKVRGQESSAMTAGSSICASNHVLNGVGPCRTLSSGTGGIVAGPMQQGAKVELHSEGMKNNVCDVTITTSLSGSDYSVERSRQKKARNQNHKRKRRESDDLGCPSEGADYESVELKKPAKRRRRAAEVHNLAERRRRDRINEKMKALQELIPNSNKTDKASMLDEAIEYLKSLQMQVQMMWMGGGMNRMMFPGIQQYFSGMSMGLSHGAHNAGRSDASGSATNPNVIWHPSSINMSNFASHMRRVQPESYGWTLGYQQSQIQPQNHFVGVPSSSIFPRAEGDPSETFRSKMGTKKICSKRFMWNGYFNAVYYNVELWNAINEWRRDIAS